MSVPDQVAKILRGAQPDKLAHGAAKSGRQARVATWATVACFVAGIWLDWRFLPTDLVPAGAAILGYWMLSAINREQAERARPIDGPRLGKTWSTGTQ